MHIDGSISRQRDLSSDDASLWEGLDESDLALAELSFPLPLNSPLRDSTVSLKPTSPSAPKPTSLAHELFSSSPVEQSRHILSPSDYDINGADMGDPWTQPDMKETQFMRQEWLASAALSYPKPIDAATGTVSSAKHKGKEKGTQAGTISKYFREAKANKPTPSPKSSLLHQLDELTGASPQPGDPDDLVSSPGPIRERSPDSRKRDRTLAPAEELTALDILNMSCSPPSQLIPHITLIKDMPEDQQEIFHRLAYNESYSSNKRSSQNPNQGVTSKSSKGKTWQSTWLNSQPNAEAGPSAKKPRKSPATARKPRGSATKKGFSWRGRPRRGRT